MFANKNNEEGREAMTLIGEEAYFHGTLTVKGSLRVEGSVEGDIADGVSIEIGKKGRIKGNVDAEVISVAGRVEGDLIAVQLVELLAGSRLIGNIRTPRLRIEEGALFAGSCSMEGMEEAQRAAHTAPAYAPVQEA